MPLPRLQLNSDSSEPMYLQLCAGLVTAIENGTLAAGMRLPAERDYAETLGVSRTTVASAYRELVDRGLLRPHVGRGTFVCAVPEAEQAPFAWRGKISTRVQRVANPALRHLITRGNDPRLISFAAGFPAIDLFPTKEFRRLTDHVLARSASAIARLAPTEGQPGLRAAIAAHFKVRLEQVMIVSGATEGLSLIADCLIDKGDAVIMDRPGYVGAIQIFRAAGADLHGWDIRNADPGELEDLIIRYRPKFIQINPTFQNPTGHTLPERDRRSLLGLAARYRVPVIENDSYRDGYFEREPPKSLYQLDGGRLVLYLSTFSKVLGPGLRLGWIIANEYMIDQLALVKERTNLFTQSLGQLVMTEFIRSGAYDRHAELVRKEHGRRCDAFFESMHRHLRSQISLAPKPSGGIYAWGRLPGGYKSADLLDRAINAGVAFGTGEIFYPDESGSEQLRFCFANLLPEQIEEGVKRLTKCFMGQQTTRPVAGKKLPLV